MPPDYLNSTLYLQQEEAIKEQIFVLV